MIDGEIVACMPLWLARTMNELPKWLPKLSETGRRVPRSRLLAAFAPESDPPQHASKILCFLPTVIPQEHPLPVTHQEL